MTGVLFVLIVFGGGMLWKLSHTELGHAVADRIRSKGNGTDPALAEEVDRLRAEVAELQERMDFAERVLSAQRDQGQLKT